MAAERMKAEVRGRVQGVGFRWFVQRTGRSLGLTGYARNLADGRRVEVVAEGERAGLEQLLDALRRGPSGAYVEDVQHSFAPATGEYVGFEIRH
jgi:acylphosphatase